MNNNLTISGVILSDEFPKLGRPITGTLFRKEGEHNEVDDVMVMTSDVTHIEVLSNVVFLVRTENSFYIVLLSIIEGDHSVEICFTWSTPKLGYRWWNKTLSQEGYLEDTVTSDIQRMELFHGLTMVRTKNRSYIIIE